MVCWVTTQQTCEVDLGIWQSKQKNTKNEKQKRYKSKQRYIKLKMISHNLIEK